MAITEQVRGAYDATFQPDINGHPDPRSFLNAEQRDEYLKQFLANLESLGTIHEAPEQAAISDDLAYAVLNREAPIEDRRMHASRAIDAAKHGFFEYAPSVGINMRKVYSRSESVSEQFVETMVDAAAHYPDKPDLKKLRADLGGMMEGDKKPEDKAVSAMAMFNVLQPYIIDRMLELNVYDPAELKQQVAALRADSALVLRFYRSVSGVAKAAVGGDSTMSTEEMADKLFDIGPIFVQLGQAFSKASNDKKIDSETKEFMHNIGQAMQEGVAMPDAEQMKKLARELPEGLKMEDAFSSAKIAYVVGTKAVEGSFATKIKRPNIERANSDGARMINLMAHIVTRYIETHVGNTKVAQKLPLIKESLPFGLALIEADIRSELDFPDELMLQERAVKVLERHKGILVPKPLPEYSDDRHITMERIPGLRIKEVPANPAYVKNALVLGLEGRRKNGLFHGDMHGGNIKAAADKPGTLVAYDWGGSFQKPRGFETKLVPFMTSIVRKNPRAMARSYRRIQSPQFKQASRAEAEAAAKAAIEVAQNRPYTVEKGEKLTKKKKIAQDTATIMTTFVGLMGKDYQSTLDARYVRYMRSTKSLITVIQQELGKPEYLGKKGKTLAKSAMKAIKEVYFTRSKE